MDGIRSHGLPAAGADRGEVRQPARRRAERAAAELREPAVRPRADGAAGGAVPARSSRITGRRSARSRTCEAVQLDEVHAFFRRYYHPAQRVARAGRRHRSGRRRSRWSTRYFGEIDAGRARRPGARRRASLPGDVRIHVRGSRRAAAALPRVADAGDVRRRRRRSRSRRPTCSPTARRRASTAGWCSTSASPPTCRRRRTRARWPATRRSPRPRRPGTRSAELERVDPRGDRAARRRRPDRRRDRARPRAGRSAVRVPAADGRRLRRQVRSAERLQRVPRATRRTSTAISQRYQVGARTASLQAGGRRAISIRRAASRSASCRTAATALAAPDSAPAVVVVTGSTGGRSLAAAGARADARRSRFPPIEKSTLPNGLRVWTVHHTQVPLVAFTLLVRRGAVVRSRRARTASRRSPPTCSTRAAAIDRRSRCTRRSRGSARSSTPTSAPTRRSPSVTVLSRFADRALGLLADIVVRPALREEDFARVRQLRLHRLTQLRDMPGAVADRAFLKLLYGAHPVRPLADRHRSVARRRCTSTTCARFTRGRSGRRSRR